MTSLSVFGLGYVGTVCAACFARMGHSVIGVDPNSVKTELIASGKSPIIETDIDRLVAEQVGAGRLRTTSDARDAVLGSKMSFICVGTPSSPNGSLNIDALRSVGREIGEALKDKRDSGHLIVVRSTVLPGTTMDVIVPEIESASGQSVGVGFEIAVNPEFMREGSAVADFYQPTRTVVGAKSTAAAKRVLALYQGLPGEKIETEIVLAELAKYIDNSWHALKVGFANEVGAICRVLGIDSHEAMRIFVADTKLNISAAYLRPGFAFGGSCLPKDVRALTYFAKMRDLDLPILGSVMRSNLAQIERGVSTILNTGKRKIAFLGFSFKPGTDDLRESPYLEVAEQLIGKGRDLRIFDPHVEMSRLIGANRDFLVSRIPHIADLMVPTIDEAIEHGDLIVLTNPHPSYEAAIGRLRPEQSIVDFSRFEAFEKGVEAYDGFSW